MANNKGFSLRSLFKRPIKNSKAGNSKEFLENSLIKGELMEEDLETVLGGVPLTGEQRDNVFVKFNVDDLDKARAEAIEHFKKGKSSNSVDRELSLEEADLVVGGIPQEVLNELLESGEPLTREKFDTAREEYLKRADSKVQKGMRM